MIKIEFKGTVTRVYEETRGQYTSKYIVAVEENSGKYPNVLRFKLKQDSTVSVDVGANVAISAYLDGREWTNPQGATMYFTDLRIDTVSVLSAAPAAATAVTQSGAKPTVATNGKELLALAVAYGEDQASVNARCVAHKAKVNRQFTAADWQAVANEIISAHAPASPTTASEFDDGLPF